MRTSQRDPERRDGLAIKGEWQESQFKYHIRKANFPSVHSERTGSRETPCETRSITASRHIYDTDRPSLLFTA
jgi:hypothetical protein